MEEEPTIENKVSLPLNSVPNSHNQEHPIEQNSVHSSPSEPKQENTENYSSSAQGAPVPGINQILHDKLAKQHALMSKENMNIVIPLVAEIKDKAYEKINEVVAKYQDKIPKDKRDLARFLTDLNEQMISDQIPLEKGQKIQAAVEEVANSEDNLK